MYLENSIINKEVLKIHKLKKGTIYVFDNFIVSEFNEGVLVDLDCLTEVYYYLNAYSENKHGFGYISNRVHQYTVKVSDFMKKNILSQKIYPTAVVAYDEASKNTFRFEKKVNNCNAVLCESLDKAVMYLTGSLTKVC